MPKDKLVTEMAAKWIGSIPTDFAMGSRIAAERILPDTSSTSMPIRSRITLSINKTSHLLVVKAKMNSVSCWGTW